MENRPNDRGNFGYGILGFCIPIVGLVLFLVWKDEKPGDARSAGIGAAVGFGLYILFYILGAVIGFAGAM